MRLIDADALMDRMYHEAFETDTDMQKWDSGCWIRYKMFENAIEEAPTIDAVSVVRCKECKHWIGETEHYEDREYKACWQLCGQYVNSEFWCKYGERREP